MKVTGVSKTNRKLLITSKSDNKDGTINCYYEEGYGTIKKEEVYTYKKQPRSSPYVVIPIEKGYKTLKECYDYYTIAAEELNKASDGLINIYQTGRFSNTAAALLNHFLTKNNIEFEDIQPFEVPFMRDCGGAFRLGVPYEGELHKHDHISFYASVYSSNHLLIPVKQGILQTITQEQFDAMPFIKYGVYYCKIEKPTGNNAKLIWVNKTNYYSSDELTFIKTHGLKIKMMTICNNFLHYPRDHCKTGAEIFGEYAKMLFEMKKKGIKSAKMLLNQLWGELIKDEKHYKYINFDDDTYVDGVDGWFSVDTDPINDELIKVTLIKTDNPFKYPLARMKPFFMAKERLTIAKEIEPFIDHVFYCHTDSIFSDHQLKIKGMNHGRLGNLKYYGVCENGWVKNANSRTPDDNEHGISNYHYGKC